MFRRVVLVSCLAAVVAAAIAGSSGAWTTNLVVLDDGTCRTNLQIGSDKTASSSATPSFLAFGDGPSAQYQVFVDGTSIGTFAANSMSNVCIYAPTLSQGPHVLTGNELAPHSTFTLTPLNFSVDSIPPAPPTAPFMNPFFDTGSSTTDGITKYRSLGFSGTAEPSSSVLMYNALIGMGGTKSDSTGAWSLATQSLADGQYQFKAAAFDSAGNKSDFSSITPITVDGTVPSATLTSPLSGQVLTGTVGLVSSVTDNLGVWKVEYQVDGVTKQTLATGGPSYTWNWNSTSVANGNHTLTALATDLAGNTASSTVTVSVLNGAATVPGAPSLNQAVGSNGSVSLSWSPTSDGGSAITGYKLYRGTASGGETLLTTLGTGTSYTDSGLTNGTTYYYKLSAVNAIGEGTQSAERSATPASVPGAPSLNSATASNGSVSLAWSAPSSNGGSAVTAYKLYRGTAGGSETFLTTLGNVTSYTDSGLANGTTYYYKLTAVNAIGEGAFSNERFATPAAAATVPSPPTLGSVSPGNGVVSIAWSAPGSDGGSPITGYRIYRGTSSGGEAFFTTVGAVTSYLDTSVANGTTYYYKVSAVNAIGESSLSNELGATPTGLPGAPTLNTATAGNALVSLAWSAPTNTGGLPLSGYKVYRSTTSGNETLLTTLGTVTSWNDSGVANGTTYYYKVTATTSAGESPLSNERSATPTAPLNVPSAPTLNTATAGNGSVALGWTAPTSNGGSSITGYKIYRGTTPGGETLFTALGNVTNWTDSGVNNGTTYYYKVSAVNAVGEGSLSGELSATPTAGSNVPSAPTLNAATAGNRTVTLGWTAPTSNGGSSITGYKIYRGTTPGGETLFTTLGNVTSWADSSVANGTTYYYKVSAVNAVGEGLLSGELSALPLTIPGAPTLNSAVAGPSSVTLNWSAPATDGGSPISAYRIYRSTTSGFEVLVASVGTVTSWTDTGVTNGTTYYYMVSAVNAAGSGGLSAEKSATPAGGSTVPGSPSLDSATGGSGSVTLSWSAPASNGGSAITGYRVYRSTVSGAETLWTTLGNVTSWTDTGLTNGTTYFYKVSAVNAVGEGPLSGERSAVPATTPSPPSLAVAGANGVVNLNWTAPTSNGGSAVTGYRVYRGTSSGSESLFATLGNVTNWSDFGVVNGTTYYYTLTAVNAIGESAASAERSAMPTGAPTAPTLNSASAGNGTVVLGWSVPTSNGGSAVTGYRVYRSTASGAETLLTTLGNVTSWTDSGLTNGVTYYYKVSALNAAGESALSAELSATPVASATVPGAPTLNSATASSGSVALSWSAPVSNGGSAITGYRVYRSTVSGAETFWTTLGNVTSWTDTGVTNGTTYYYKVTAVNAIGEGSQSNERSGTPAGVPGSPSLTATAGNASVSLSWGAPSSNGSAITGYRIYRSTSTGTETLLTTVGSTTTGYTDSGLTNGVTYYYLVSALNGMGEGLPSAERFATPQASATVPGAPTLNTATAGSGSVALSWSAPASNGGSAVTGYRIYRGTFSGGESLFATLGNVTSYTDFGVTNGTAYYYKVTASNAIGEGSQSNELSSTPAGVPGSPSLTATAGNTTVSLGWSTPPSNGSAITGFRIYRSTVSGAETLLTTVASTTTGYTDAGLTNGVTYYYEVSAVNGKGEGLPSAEQFATPSAPATVPGAPTLNTATAGSGSVALSWSAPASNGGSAVTGYRIYRGTFSGGESLLTTLGNVTSYTDFGVTNGSTYYYEVSAVNAIGEGAFSNERSATPFSPDPTPPSQPTGLKVVTTGTTGVVLDWTNSTDNVGVTGYQVYRDGILVGTSPYSFYLDSGLAVASTHTWAVAAVDAANNASVKSSTVSTRTDSTNGSNGTLIGVVFNTSGSPLTNAIAQTTLPNGTTKKDNTKGNGVWQLSSMTPGSYNVTISLAGYTSRTIPMTAIAGQTVLAATALS